MFFCDPCAKENGWPMSMFKSSGRCEMCEKQAACSDIPSRQLPLPKPKLENTMEIINAKPITLVQQIANKFLLSTATVNAIIEMYNPSGVQQPPLLECDDWQRKDGGNVSTQGIGERRVVWNLFQYLASHDFYPHVYNDGDETEVIKEDDKILAAMNAIFAVDEAAVGMKHKDAKNWHDIVFIMGNSPEEVISDWHYYEDDRDGFNALMDAFKAEAYV